jgi:hypothetical protein
MGEPGSDTGRNMSERLCGVQEVSKGLTFRQLQTLTDEDVVRRHDVLMDPEIGYGELGPEDYRAELGHRETLRQPHGLYGSRGLLPSSPSSWSPSRSCREFPARATERLSPMRIMDIPRLTSGWVAHQAAQLVPAEPKPERQQQRRRG